MTRKLNGHSRRAVLTLVAALAIGVLLPATQALAQAQPGSTGGSIGRQGKSVSGGEESAAPARQRASKQKASKPRRAARAPVETESRGGGGASVLGLWRWSATCERGQRSYSGTMTFEQSGSGVTASHGGTNFWDGGTITNVRASGGGVSFDRQFAHFRDHVSLAMVRGGARMSGVMPNTEHSGRCQLSFVKD